MRLKPLNDYTQPPSLARGSGAFERESRFGSPGIARGNVSVRSKVLLVGSLGILWTGLLAAVALRMFNASSSPVASASEVRPIIIEKQALPEMVDVLMPVKEIQPNAELRPEDFIKVSRPRLAVAAGAVTSFEEIRNAYAKALIPANQIVSRETLSREQAANAVIRDIPAGFRAVSITMNATSSVEGWARAGARVDVVWIGELRGEKVLRKLVENTKVLSAERRLDPSADPSLPVPATATLLVAERDAQRIGLAQTAGSLVLLLRGANDTHGGSGDGTLTWSDLLGRSGNRDEKGVEGVVRIKEKGGAYKEFAIVDGAVMKRKE